MHVSKCCELWPQDGSGMCLKVINAKAQLQVNSCSQKSQSGSDVSLLKPFQKLEQIELNRHFEIRNEIFQQTHVFKHKIQTFIIKIQYVLK